MFAKRILLMLTLLCICLTIQGRNFEEFRQELLTAPDWKTAKTKLIAYLPTTTNVEELRELQSIWQSVEPDACREYFIELQKKNPNMPVYAYLALRLEPDETLQMNAAEELCRKFPDFYWGYRLFLVDYMTWLLNAELELTNPLQNQESALKIIDEGYKRFPEDDYFHIFQFHRHRIQKNYALAEAELTQIKDRNLLTANWMRIKYFLVQNKNATLYKTLMPNLLSDLIKNGQLASADSIYSFAEGYVEILQETENKIELEQYLVQNPILLKSYPYFDVYAGILANKKEWKTLDKCLLNAFDSGAITKEQLNNYLTNWEDELSKCQNWITLQAKAELDNKLPEQK